MQFTTFTSSETTDAAQNVEVTAHFPRHEVRIYCLMIVSCHCHLLFLIIFASLSLPSTLLFW